MYFAGSCTGIWQAYNRISLFEMPGGFGGFGILIGLVIGHLHGMYNLAKRKPLEKADSTSTLSAHRPANLLENPYEAPAEVHKSS